jgi:hypothetical protein
VIDERDVEPKTSCSTAPSVHRRVHRSCTGQRGSCGDALTHRRPETPERAGPAEPHGNVASPGVSAITDLG